MKRIFGSALVAMALCLASGIVLADTITLPTVTVVGISNDGARLACTGYECASFLESVGGVKTFYAPMAGMGESGGFGQVDMTRAQFCNQLSSQKPSGCDQGSPPSVPIYDPSWEANGCGTGGMANIFLSMLMDDLYKDHYSGSLDAPVHTSNGVNISFLGACDHHDGCWGSAGSRGNCDRTFRTEMENQCSGLSGADSEACLSIASVYYGAVSSDAATEHYDQSVADHTCAAWAYDMRRNSCT
jgi:hypothetical protein